MRVLVILRAPWRNDNNSGNTMTNFFSDIDAEFYSLSMRSQIPQNNIAVKNYAISESQLIESIFKGKETGTVLEKKDYDSVNSITSDEGIEETVYKTAKKFRRYILFYVREMLWKSGKWKNRKLDGYIDEVSPDVIVMPVFNCMYPYRILQYIHKKTNAKVILFHFDDNYTLRQFSLNPIFWIYRLNLRRYIKKAVAISSVNYAISSVQKNEYEKIFNKEFKLITKFSDFSEEPKLKQSYSYPLQFVFTGNLDTNRWKTLGAVAKEIKKINEAEPLAQLRIYSATPLTEKMKKALEIPEASFFMGKASAAEIEKIQSDADVLVHAESYDIKSRFIIRQSFSTKLVDYMKRARLIFAVGPGDAASVSHLRENDAAVIAVSEQEIASAVKRIVENKSLLNEYAKKGYECGKKFHNKDNLEKMLTDDLKK